MKSEFNKKKSVRKKNIGTTLCKERKGEEFVNPSLKNQKSIR